TFFAQQPGHGRQRTRRDCLAVVFVSTDVAVLTERAAHVARSEKDRPRAHLPAIDQLFALMMKESGHARVARELARAQLRTVTAIDLTIPATEVAVT